MMEPEKMKALGNTMKERQGDYIITFEIIGYVKGHNVWAEKKRQYSPRPSLSGAIAMMDEDDQLQRTKLLRQKIKN